MVDDAMDRIPVQRVPVTQEWLAQQMANGGGDKEHPARAYFGEILFRSIEKMIFRLAYKYKPTCREFQLEDLVSDCYCRILEKLDTFDPEKGKFTTWSWRVSESVLTRRYHEAKKHKDNRADFAAADSCPVTANLYLRNDISRALSDLFYDWPEHFEILRAMFGGTPFSLSGVESRETQEGGFNLPDSMNVKRVAEHSGFSRRQVRRVLSTVVCPFFIERFGENDESNESNC